MSRLLNVVLCFAVAAGLCHVPVFGQTPKRPPSSPVGPPPGEPLAPQTLEEQLASAIAKGDHARAGELYTLLGQKALDNGQPSEAIANLQRALDVAPTTTRARYLLAAAFAASGDIERSGLEIKAAFDVDPADARSADYQLLARSRRAAGNPKTGTEALRLAIRRYPLDVDLRVELARSLVAEAKPAQGLFELLYARMLVRADGAQARTIAQLIDSLKTLTEQAKDDPDPALELTFSFLDDVALDQQEMALPAIQDVVQRIGPDEFLPRLLLAQCLAATGRLGEAEKIFSQVVERDPLCVPALAGLADLYYTEGRPETAKKVIERAAKIDAQNPLLKQVVAAWQP